MRENRRTRDDDDAESRDNDESEDASGSDDDSPSDWEVGDADDDDVDYVLDQRERWRRQQQQDSPPVLALPEPASADEASAILGGLFRASQRTPQELRRLLEARADPNIVVAHDSICPLDNIITFARGIHVPS